jgi:hypothetical protein
MTEVITAEEYASRLRVWCGKGRSYDQLPSKRKDRWILYHAICREITPDEVLTEPGINEWLRNWLTGIGSPLQRIDIALIRRELIEKGFLQRDPAGREYRRSGRHERDFTFEAAVEKLDPNVIIESAGGRGE